MSTTLEVHGDQKVIDWCATEDLDPFTLSPVVRLNDDGTVTMRRQLRDSDGRLRVVDNEIATEELIVTPHTPFPVPPDAIVGES
jgi:hypothetical protein